MMKKSTKLSRAKAVKPDDKTIETFLIELDQRYRVTKQEQ